jgi:putative nucleotidyltransferase with HDIG domain
VLSSLRHQPGLLVVVGLVATLPGALMEAYGQHPVTLAGIQHFGFVTAAALAAAVASAGLTAAGVRQRDGRTILLGTAFSTMTALLAVHALATPGVLVGPNGVTAIAGAASMPVGAAVLALTALPGLRRPRSVAPLLVLQAMLGAGIVALGTLAMAFPGLLPRVPAPASPAAVALLAIGAPLFLLLAHRALSTFALTRRPADLLVCVGCCWLAVALIPQLLVGPGTLGYYAGHALELAGILLIAVPAVLDLRGGGASRPLVGDLSAAEIVVAEEAYLGPRVRALMVRLAAQDVSTEAHTRRVALLAVRLGEALNLPPAELRHLAVGGLLHDIGKLAIPAEILQKPGPLDDREFAEVKRHPEAGTKLLRDLGGFPDQVHHLVAEHHERLDGGGYPAGRAGPQLGIGSRVLAVCDVYDALVSDRVYRPAWPQERALALLREEAGTGYDGRVVWALEQVLGAGARASVAAS